MVEYTNDPRRWDCYYYHYGCDCYCTPSCKCNKHQVPYNYGASQHGFVIRDKNDLEQAKVLLAATNLDVKG